MLWKVVVWVGLGLFVLLSATDWVLTFALLKAQPEAVESNPFAAACLERHGWTGLAVYKAGGVLAFAGSIALLVQRRPVVAAGVVALGCAVLLSVTTYTHRLICEAHRDAAERAYHTAPAERDPLTPRSGYDPPVPRCWFSPESLFTSPHFANVLR